VEAMKKILTDWGLGSTNFITEVMTMMKLVMEAVMLIVIVSGMVFMTKVSANENSSDDTLPDKSDDDLDSDDS
jgi:hypothetical protein